jgi:hypothetical protein
MQQPEMLSNFLLQAKNFVLNIPASKEFKLVKAGTVSIKDSGFYTISLSSVKKTGNTIADIQSIELSGTATENMHFNLNQDAMLLLFTCVILWRIASKPLHSIARSRSPLVRILFTAIIWPAVLHADILVSR